VQRREEMTKKKWPEPHSSAARLISGWRGRNSGRQPAAVRKIELRRIGGGRTAGTRKFNVQRRGPCGFQLRGDGNIFVFPRHLRVVRTTLAAHRLCFASCLAASSFGHVLLLHLIFYLHNQVTSIVLNNLTKILGAQT
jgi:hypothetical protein